MVSGDAIGFVYLVAEKTDRTIHAGSMEGRDMGRQVVLLRMPWGPQAIQKHGGLLPGYHSGMSGASQHPGTLAPA